MVIHGRNHQGSTPAEKGLAVHTGHFGTNKLFWENRSFQVISVVLGGIAWKGHPLLCIFAPKLLLMPTQCGPFPITGTIGNVCFYRMEGVYYARMKSSLTRKRVLKSAAFRSTREHATTLGIASQIASKVYRLVKGSQKKHALYREITGKAIYLLREGKDKEEVFQRLCEISLHPEVQIEVAPDGENDREKSISKDPLPKPSYRQCLSVPKLRKTYAHRKHSVRDAKWKRILFINRHSLNRRNSLGP